MNIFSYFSLHISLAEVFNEPLKLLHHITGVCCNLAKLFMLQRALSEPVFSATILPLTYYNFAKNF